MTASPSSLQPQTTGSSLPSKSRWILLRIILALGGATLVLFPIASGNNYAFSIAGLLMFVAAILLPPAKPRITLEQKARELSALAVVDGGRLRFPNSSSSAPVRLFVTAACILALDTNFRALLEIPAAEITSFLAIQAQEGWFLEIAWSSHAVEFAYRGDSAERLARAAENAIRGVTSVGGPVVPQRRAAGA